MNYKFWSYICFARVALFVLGRMEYFFFLLLLIISGGE